MDNLIEILSTKELSHSLIEAAGQKGLHIDVSPFIRTEPVASVEMQQEIELIETQNTCIVFTSANAVEAVSMYAGEAAVGWEIFCIGYATAERAKKYFPFSRIMGLADDAESLAELIIESYDGEEVYFFCGDLRRDLLPALLRENAMDVSEVIVYQTIPVPHKLKKQYKGVLFYSPSGVDSFFSMNKLPQAIPLFAIGSTTANAIKKYGYEHIFISKKPTREDLLDEVIDFFT